MFKYISRMFQVMAILSVHVPKAIADGVVTTEEIMFMAKELFAVFGVVSFKVPDMPVEVATEKITVAVPTK